MFDPSRVGIQIHSIFVWACFKSINLLPSQRVLDVKNINSPTVSHAMSWVMAQNCTLSSPASRKLGGLNMSQQLRAQPAPRLPNRNNAFQVLVRLVCWVCWCVLSGQWNKTFSKNSSWKGQGQANACGPQIFTECSSGNVKAKRSSFHNFIMFHHSSVASKPAFWLSCIHLWHVSSEIRWARLCARLPMTATLKWYRMISTLLFFESVEQIFGHSGILQR